MHTTIGVIGLGYVGLPLAVTFGSKYNVTAFDTDEQRIVELQAGYDRTGEVGNDLLSLVSNQQADTGIYFTGRSDDLFVCNVFIITVPTPVHSDNSPDLDRFREATATVASVLKKGDIVIYESTVYPGCTEEVGVPILERISGLAFNHDFFCGYSPERINPGDKKRDITSILKIISGSTDETADRVDGLYRSVITAGTYRAPSIKVAEAAKVIENTQRDINIAFINELTKVFHLLGIDTQEVLNAAATKWNFFPFQPGLVGGHCIGIDPYYLSYKANEAGYVPEILLSARKVNNGMGRYVAQRVLQLMKQKSILPGPATEVLIMGITFKENFSDVRNSRVVDIVQELKEHGLQLTIFDPLASPASVEKYYQLQSCTELVKRKYKVIIIAVSHNEFLTIDFSEILEKPGILFDVKGRLKSDLVDGRL